MSNRVDNRYEGTDVFWTNSVMALAAERSIKAPWISFGTCRCSAIDIKGVTDQQINSMIVALR